MLSFIIPVYNVPIRYFVDCISSIINISKNINFEILICNDGSNDFNTKQYEDYIRNIKRVRYFRFIENKGINFARNMCISESAGDWLALVDADDVLTNNYVEELYPVLEKDVHLIYADHEQYNENITKVIQIRQKAIYHQLYQIFGNTAFDPMLWATYIFHPQIFSRESICSIGMFNTTYSSGDEVDMHLKISEEFGISAIHHIPKGLYKYRNNKHSVVHDANYYKKLIENIEHILSYHYGLRSIVQSSAKRTGRCINTNAAHYRHIDQQGNLVELPWFDFKNMKILL